MKEEKPKQAPKQEKGKQGKQPKGEGKPKGEAGKQAAPKVGCCLLACLSVRLVISFLSLVL